MSKLSKSLRCFNPRTGFRDGKYCRFKDKCLQCQAADEIEKLEKELTTRKPMSNPKYKANSTEEAVLHALSELLKADTMGMAACNADRLSNDMGIAYGEEHFYAAGEKLRDYLGNLEVADEQ